MTEEELAASLGLKQSWRMRLVRLVVVGLASRSNPAEGRYIKALSYYQQLGERLVDKNSNQTGERMRAQIALILLSASIRRDIARRNSTFLEDWAEDLEDAQMYALNVGESRVVDEISRLLDAAGY